MFTKQERAEQAGQEEARRAERQKAEEGLLEAVIRDGVMCGWGEPADFLRASAGLLWDNHSRVNVFVGPPPASARVAHSFFLEADSDGKILSSSPAVTRLH